MIIIALINDDNYESTEHDILCVVKLVRAMGCDRVLTHRTNEN